MGKIYNIPLSQNFLENLARFIVENESINDEQTSNTRVFLPNRLSCLILQQNISGISKLREYPKKKFPKIYSISDEIFLDQQKISALVLPILLKNTNFSENSIDILYSLAESISSVVQSFVLNDIEFSKVHLHFPENLQDYWSHYRTILDEVLKNTEIDQYIQNSKRKLQIFMDSLRNNQVIAAGIGISNYCVLEFLRKILNSENGAVVIQGIESKNSENYILNQQLLHQLNVSEKDVINYAHNKKSENLFDENDDTSKVQLAEFENISEEALAVSFIVRKAIHENQSIVVASNGNSLTEKILLKLRDLNIRGCAPKNSSLSENQKILFSCLLDLLERNFTTEGSIKFFKMFPKFRSHIQKIELFLRKTESVYSSFFDAYEFYMKTNEAIEDCKKPSQKNDADDQEFHEYIKLLKSFYLEDYQKETFSNWLDICVKFLEIIDFELGLKFEDIVRVFLRNFTVSHAINFSEFSILCKNYVINKEIMNFYLCDHNIILGTALDVQLLDADLVVISGANAENWSVPDDNDTWMTRQILRQFSKNFSAQNEIQLKCILERFLRKKNVLITRSKMVRGETQSPIEMLRSIKNAIIKANSSEKKVDSDQISKDPSNFDAQMHLLNRESHDLSAVIRADWIEKIMKYEQSADDAKKITFDPPRPSVDLRPQKFSATGIKLLHDNPYNFYAKYILKLRELNRLNERKNIRGNFIHKVLENFVKSSSDKTNLQNLIDVSKDTLQKMHLNESDFGLWFFRLPRLLKFVVRNLDNNMQSFSEIEGKINLEIAPGKSTYVTSKADRIDISPNGKVAIIDYKTGTVPAIKEVKIFESPQLLIEGLIYTNNGFDIPIVGTPEIDLLAFWALNEPESGGKITIISEDYEEIKNLLSSAKEKLIKMLIEYNVNGIAYDYNLKYKYDRHYAHLVRKKEWSDV